MVKLGTPAAGLPYVSGLGHIKRRLDVQTGHVAFVALLGAAKTHVSVRLLFVPVIPIVFVTSESSKPGGAGS